MRSCAMSDSLDRDTAVLEGVLGDVLEEQEGRAFRDRVFWLRDTAARVRGGDAGAAALSLRQRPGWKCFAAALNAHARWRSN